MSETRYLICPLCEAMCGLAVEVQAGHLVQIRGDLKDPFSRGYLCPKALALKDVHEDPRRLRRPLRKVDRDWVEVDWDTALEEAAGAIASIQRRYGKDSVAFYTGNPNIH